MEPSWTLEVSGDSTYPFRSEWVYQKVRSMRNIPIQTAVHMITFNALRPCPRRKQWKGYPPTRRAQRSTEKQRERRKSHSVPNDGAKFMMKLTMKCAYRNTARACKSPAMISERVMCMTADYTPEWYVFKVIIN